MYKLVSTKFKDTIFVTGGTGHSQTELLSLSTWTWERRAPCPLRRLNQMPSLYLNGLFYVFGQMTESEDIIESARFDPLKNEWKELGGFNEQRKRFAVVNTNYGVVIVDGEQAKPKLCQISDIRLDCEVMKNNDPDLIVSNGEPILFTFDHTQCPKSVIASAMLLFIDLGNYYRNALK